MLVTSFFMLTLGLFSKDFPIDAALAAGAKPVKPIVSKQAIIIAASTFRLFMRSPYMAHIMANYLRSFLSDRRTLTIYIKISAFGRTIAYG